MMTHTHEVQPFPDTPAQSPGDEPHTPTLNAILSASTEFICLFDTQGRYLYASENITTFLGLKQSDFLGKTWQEIGLVEKFMEIVDAQRQRVMETGRTVMEEMPFPGDSEIRWVASVANPVMNAHANIESVIVSCHDITERKQGEATYRLASIIESSSDAIFTKTLQGVITTWNGSAEKLFGYTASEMIGQPITLLAPPHLQEEPLHILERIKAGESVKAYETILRRKGGSSVEVSLTVSPLRNSQGSIIGASTISHDITERKQAEAVIHNLSRQKIDILESITDAFFALDTSWHMTYVNKQAETLMQLKREELIGRNLWEVFPEAVGSSFDYQYHKALAEGVTVEFEEFFPPHHAWYAVHAYPSSSGLAVYYQNVNERRKAAEVLQGQTKALEMRSRELEQLNADLSHQRDELATVNVHLEEANRARSQFLATMSHELRTPLASIIGFSQMLLDDAAQAGWNQRQHKNLERIFKNGQHLLGLINDVLDIAKIEAGRMVLTSSQVDVRELLTGVVEEIQSIALARDLDLSVEVEEGADFLETNPEKLRQILINLVSNALKFTERGEVTISARRVISPGGEANRLALAVRDTGVGIPTDAQEHIFEAFYQVDGSYTRKVGGTGLGLSIVSQLTTLLGGTVELTSAPGQGSTFTVLLPIKALYQYVEQDIPRLQEIQQPEASLLLPIATEFVPELLHELLAAAASQKATDGQNTLVLAVDDNPDILVLIKAAMKDTLYTVVGVQDSSQLLPLVQEVRPCAIILDVMMPHLNGWQLLHHLKENPATASIPVVILSVLSEPITGYVLGADAYLMKPFHTEMLLTTLQRVITAQKDLVQASRRETQSV